MAPGVRVPFLEIVCSSSRRNWSDLQESVEGTSCSGLGQFEVLVGIMSSYAVFQHESTCPDVSILDGGH
jgi:hypothetical protein